MTLRLRLLGAVLAGALLVLSGCGDGVSTSGEDSIYAQAASGDLTPVRHALSNGFNVNAPDENGQTLLHHAVSGRQAPVVEALIVSFRADPAVKDSKGQNPIELAIELAEPSVLEVLYNEGLISY